ncbi:TPA: hypothetical protein DCF80_01165 [Candidatus Saccharibacteria bacterium]|nr:hypothetical protein [Candidatus Saccharibacteria bacterium]
MTKRHNKSFDAAVERQETERRAAAASTRSVATPTIEVHRASHRFWLVQRLDPCRRPGGGWFGGKFELDYMGSSEFEFGATHRSLERMRQLGGFRLVSVNITRNGVTKPVYCVAPGPDEEAADKITDFIGWATPDHPRAMEATFFDLLFDENFRFIKREYIHTIAWWSLDDDFLWTLDREVAEQLLYGLEHPAKA